MTIQKRSVVMAALLALGLFGYAAARYYSPALVFYVVEQSLVQKAPSGTDRLLIHERLHALVLAIPDPKARMEKLLQISEYLEKVQGLKPEKLDELLATAKPGGTQGL